MNTLANRRVLQSYRGEVGKQVERERARDMLHTFCLWVICAVGVYVMWSDRIIVYLLSFLG